MHSSLHFPVSSTSRGGRRLYACVCAATLHKRSVKQLIIATGDSECFHVTCRTSSHRKNDSAVVGFEQTLPSMTRRTDAVYNKSPGVEFAVDPKLSSQHVLLLIDWVIQSSRHLLQLLPLERKFISLSTRRKSGTHTCAAYVCHIPWRMVTICWRMSFQARSRHKWSRWFVFSVRACVSHGHHKAQTMDFFKRPLLRWRNRWHTLMSGRRPAAALRCAEHYRSEQTLNVFQLTWHRIGAATRPWAQLLNDAQRVRDTLGIIQQREGSKTARNAIFTSALSPQSWGMSECNQAKWVVKGRGDKRRSSRWDGPGCECGCSIFQRNEPFIQTVPERMFIL